MKLTIATLALTCSIICLGSIACAQSGTSRTYFGTNGPQGGERPGSHSGPGVAPEDFLANIYGDGNELAIEVMSPGGDICGRPFYFTGTILFPPNTTTGTIGGPMLRCTNPELVVYCNQSPIYEVGYTGTVERNGGQYIITIKYPDQKWLKEDCQNKREDVGQEKLVFNYQPPTPPPPTLKDKIDRAEKDAVDTLYKSVRGGRWLQNRPR